MTYQCLFGASHLSIFLYIYWKVTDNNDGNYTSFTTSYRPSPRCPNRDYYDCCEFFAEINLNTSTFPGEVFVTCYAAWFQQSSSNTSSLSE